MSATDLDRDDPDVEAAEYVLGTLSSQERDAFGRRLAADPDLRASVAAWEARLSPLADGIAAVEPDARSWPAILARVAGEAKRDGSAKASNIVHLERSVRRWRSAAVGAGALAACLAVLFVGQAAWRPAVDPGQRYVAVVNRGGELPALMVRIDTATGAVDIRSLAADTPADRSLELWYVPAGGTPRSLGVLDAAAPRPVVPAALRAAAGQGASLAVSVEPKGGSPTGTATGPIVYSGRLVKD